MKYLISGITALIAVAIVILYISLDDDGDD